MSKTLYKHTELFHLIFGHNNVENMPKSTQFGPKWVHNFAKYLINLKILPKISKFLLNWRHFAKSSHTASETHIHWKSVWERLRHRKCALVVWIEYLSERKIMDESYCEFERERGRLWVCDSSWERDHERDRVYTK